MLVDGSSSASPIVMVKLPAVLIRLFPGSIRQLELAASTVGEVIDLLDRRWPGMRDRLCDSTPRIRRHINVFVAGERATLTTRLTPGVEVLIMTAMSGG
jgi:molybdopterin synthase sulfur carrier subunit